MYLKAGMLYHIAVQETGHECDVTLSFWSPSHKQLDCYCHLKKYPAQKQDDKSRAKKIRLRSLLSLFPIIIK